MEVGDGVVVVSGRDDSVFVADGIVVAVVVGSDAALTPLPQAVKNKDTIKVRNINCFIRFMKRGLLIEFPDNTQTVQRKPGRDDIDHVSLLGDDFGESARGDDLHIASQLGSEAGHHALDHAHIPEQQP